MKKRKSLQELVKLGVLPECPKCGSNTIWKTGKRGAFLSCTRFPECSGKLNLEDLTNPASTSYGTTKLLTKGKRPTNEELKYYHRIKKVVWKDLGVNKPSNVEMTVLLTRKLGKSINTIADVKRAAIEYYEVINV